MSFKLPSLKPRDVIRILRELGFVEERQKGIHKVFVRGADYKVIIVPFHSKDLKRGTLRSIIKKTGLSVEKFLKCL
ncbi:MAG: type II toxin-antitoxin system HicA family toxin [Myxococcota bacterium]